MNNILYLAFGDGKELAERLYKKTHKVGYILRPEIFKCDVISVTVREFPVSTRSDVTGTVDIFKNAIFLLFYEITTSCE